MGKGDKLGMNQNSNMPKSLKRAYYRTIEEELYNYRFIKGYIEKTINDFLETDYEPALKATTINDLYSSNGISNKRDYDNLHAHNSIRVTSNPTLEKALKLIYFKNQNNKVSSIISTIGFAEMVRKIEAIDDVLERFESSSIGDQRSKAGLVKDRYFVHELTPDGLALKYSISKKTVYNWCYDVIYEIAKRLGLDLTA